MENLNLARTSLLLHDTYNKQRTNQMKDGTEVKVVLVDSIGLFICFFVSKQNAREIFRWRLLFFLIHYTTFCIHQQASRIETCKHSVVGCCRLKNTQVCDDNLFRQVSTCPGRYQLPIFCCTNVHLLYSDKLAHKQIVTNCLYSVAQIVHP